MYQVTVPLSFVWCSTSVFYGIYSVMQEDRGDEGLHPGKTQEERDGDIYVCTKIIVVYHKPPAIAANSSGTVVTGMELRSTHNFICIHEGKE